MKNIIDVFGRADVWKALITGIYILERDGGVARLNHPPANHLAFVGSIMKPTLFFDADRLSFFFQ